MQKFGWFCDIIDLNGLEWVSNSGIEEGAGHNSFVFGEISGEVAFIEVVDIGESAVFEAILLLFISAIENGTDEVIGFFPLHYIVQYLSLILPHEISYW